MRDAVHRGCLDRHGSGAGTIGQAAALLGVRRDQRNIAPLHAVVQHDGCCCNMHQARCSVSVAEQVSDRPGVVTQSQAEVTYRAGVCSVAVLVAQRIAHERIHGVAIALGVVESLQHEHDGRVARDAALFRQRS